jgi:hypothetical protein
MKRASIPALALIAAAAALFGVVGTANADPENSPNSEIIELTCTGGISGTFEIVTNGNGMWTPGHVIGSNQMLIPYSFEFTETFTPTGGGDPEVFTESIAKKAPRNGRLAECTFGETITIPEGTIEFTGVVGVSYTPAR